MGGIEWQHGAAVRAGATRGQRSAAGELVHLAAELADAEPGDRRLMVQAVAAHDVDGTFEHQPARRVARAHLVDELAWGEFADLAAGETPRGLDLGRVQHRKHLGTAGLDKRHDGSLAGATRSQSPRAQGSSGVPACGRCLRRAKADSGHACPPLMASSWSRFKGGNEVQLGTSPRQIDERPRFRSRGVPSPIPP